MFIIVNDLHSTIRVCLIRKTVSSRQNSTRQDKTVLERDIEKIFFMLENKNGILIFLIVLYSEQKVVSWFSEGQEFLFSFSLLLPVLSSLMTGF